MPNRIQNELGTEAPRDRNIDVMWCIIKITYWASTEVATLNGKKRCRNSSCLYYTTWQQGLKGGFSCPARRVRLAAGRVQTAEWTRWHRRRSGTSDLRHSGTVPNAGRISGRYRPNHFLRVTARVIVQSNKTHYVLLLTKSVWYWLPRGHTSYRPTIGWVTTHSPLETS